MALFQKLTITVKNAIINNIHKFCILFENHEIIYFNHIWWFWPEYRPNGFILGIKANYGKWQWLNHNSAFFVYKSRFHFRWKFCLFQSDFGQISPLWKNRPIPAQNGWRLNNQNIFFKDHATFFWKFWNKYFGHMMPNGTIITSQIFFQNSWFHSFIRLKIGNKLFLA